MELYLSASYKPGLTQAHVDWYAEEYAGGWSLHVEVDPDIVYRLVEAFMSALEDASDGPIQRPLHGLLVGSHVPWGHRSAASGARVPGPPPSEYDKAVRDSGGRKPGPPAAI